MTVAPTLFDAVAAETAARHGMDKAARAERVQEWKRQADELLAELAAGATLTADTLVAYVGLPDAGPARNNVVGAWFSAKAKAGRLEWTGTFRKSERVAGHGNLQRVWRVIA